MDQGESVAANGKVVVGLNAGVGCRWHKDAPCERPSLGERVRESGRESRAGSRGRAAMAGGSPQRPTPAPPALFFRLRDARSVSVSAMASSVSAAAMAATDAATTSAACQRRDPAAPCSNDDDDDSQQRNSPAELLLSFRFSVGPRQAPRSFSSDAYTADDRNHRRRRFSQPPALPPSSDPGEASPAVSPTPSAAPLSHPFVFSPTLQATITTDEHMSVLTANDIFCHSIQASEDEIVGSSALATLAPQFHQHHLRLFAARRASLLRPSTDAVLACGIVVRLVKKDGSSYPASLWLKEKTSSASTRIFIWVFEPIDETVAEFQISSADGSILAASGNVRLIFGYDPASLIHRPLSLLAPKIPCSPTDGCINLKQLRLTKFFGGRSASGQSFPTIIRIADHDPSSFDGAATNQHHTSPKLLSDTTPIAQTPTECNDAKPSTSKTIQIVSMPHIAGVVTIFENGAIQSINTVFSKYLFGRSANNLVGSSSITDLLPDFWIAFAPLAPSEHSPQQQSESTDAAQSTPHVTLPTTSSTILPSTPVSASTRRISNILCISSTASSYRTHYSIPAIWNDDMGDSQHPPHFLSALRMFALHRDGTQILVDVHVRPLITDSGKTLAIWITCRTESDDSCIVDRQIPITAAEYDPSIDGEKNRYVSSPIQDELHQKHFGPTAPMHMGDASDRNASLLAEKEVEPTFTSASAPTTPSKAHMSLLMDTSVPGVPVMDAPVPANLSVSSEPHVACTQLVSKEGTGSVVDASSAPGLFSKTSTLSSPFSRLLTLKDSNATLRDGLPKETDLSKAIPSQNGRTSDSFGEAPLNENCDNACCIAQAPLSAKDASGSEIVSDTMVESVEADGHSATTADIRCNVSIPDNSTVPSAPIFQTRPTSIDEFEVIKPLGEGAYGYVRLAHHINDPMKTPVVIKYVVKSRVLSWCRREHLGGRIPVEVAILHTLTEKPHPNIVEMLDFFQDDIFVYVIMRRQGDIDLFELIEANDNLDESVIRHIFMQVALAVKHLHAHQIVHRDIKDENIVVDPTTHSVTLIDFGSSAYIEPSRTFSTFYGTMDFAAPEVLEGNPYDGRPQDIWALGILLYTLLYRENPFYSVDEILSESGLRIPFVVSNESLDLLQMLLSRGIESRPTIDRVLKHPWLCHSL